MPTIMNLDPQSMEYVDQGRCRLVFVEGEGAAERESDVGIVTVAEGEMSAESTPVYSGNSGKRVKVGSLSNETGMNFNFTTISITRDVRTMALLGLSQVMNLPANANFEKVVGSIAVGDRIALGRPVDDVEIGDLEPGVDFEVIDNRRVVLIKNKPVGTPASVTVTGSAPAVQGGLKVEIGRNPDRKVHLRLYGNDPDKPPFTMDVPRGVIRPSSAIGFQGENDPLEAEFSVEVEATPNGGFGTLEFY